MGVRTTADDKVDAAKDYVQRAIECLSEVVIGKCYGTSEYSVDYLNKLRKQLVVLLEMRDA